MNKKAFTLVELIVVITILAILGTIAFISLQWYSRDARDSTRISDLSAMKTGIELFHLWAGKYPNPTDTFNVEYSWSTVWSQWLFGDTTTANVDKLDKKPVDPLTEKEYTYSVTNTKQEYQLSWLLESWDTAFNSELFNWAYAWDTIATAVVTWNYNWAILKTLSGTTCEILSLPSIISAEANTDLVSILNNERLVYDWYNNLPSNYNWSKYNELWWFAFTSGKLVVYTDNDSCNDLKKSDTTWTTARQTLIENLQIAYTWTILANVDKIEEYTTVDTTDTDAVALLSSTLVNNSLGGSLEVNNTETQISYNDRNCNEILTNDPSKLNQDWI